MSDSKENFSVQGFYGSKNKRKWIGIERSVNELVKKHKQERIPSPFPLRILGPSTSWKTFFRQKDAFDYSRSKAKDLHVFAFETDTYDGNTGQRMYLVTSYAVFWHYYSQMLEDQRHHYEVIPEGAVCKLYFDLEFSLALNPNSDGNKMVEVLIQFVCQALELEFGVKCTREDVLDLDASTNEKFSRHLIFQMKKAVFKDNIHTGRFVCYMISQLMKYKQTMEADLTQVTPSDITEPIMQHDCSIKQQFENIQDVNNKVATETDEKDKDCSISLSLGIKNNSETKVCDKNSSCFLRDNSTDVTKNHSDSLQGETTASDRNSSDMSLQGETKASDRNSSDMSLQGETKASDRNSSDMSLQGETKDSDRNSSDMSLQGEKKASDRNSSDMSLQGEAKDNGRNISEFDERYRDVLQHFTKDDLELLVIKNKNDDDGLFCDLGVYTKNRNFRLYLSSKLNKQNPLVLSTENKCQISDKQEDIFLQSLISNIKFSSATQILSFEKECDGVGYPRTRLERAEGKDTIEGYSKSPYPEVDEHITGLITANGNRGSIRHWTYFHQGELLLYEISRFRYCHNIRRQHRSNNIMFIVDLHKGVFYQKCHDPDCYAQNYKSTEWRLPKNVLPESYFTDIEDDFELETDDQELLDSTLELEQQVQNKSTDLQDLNDDEDEDLINAAEMMETNENTKSK